MYTYLAHTKEREVTSCCLKISFNFAGVSLKFRRAITWSHFLKDVREPRVGFQCQSIAALVCIGWMVCATVIVVLFFTVSVVLFLAAFIASFLTVPIAFLLACFVAFFLAAPVISLAVPVIFLAVPVIAFAFGVLLVSPRLFPPPPLLVPGFETCSLFPSGPRNLNKVEFSCDSLTIFIRAHANRA
jgi:hypothetical protein